MRRFFEGFEKQAASLVGSMPGIRSGLKAFKARGEIGTASPKSGITIGPRSTAQSLPTPKPMAPDKNVEAIKLPQTRPHVPEPGKR